MKILFDKIDYRIHTRKNHNNRQRDKAMWTKILILELRDSGFKSYIQSKFNNLEQLTKL